MTESFKVAPYGTVAWIWTISFIVGVLFFGARTVAALSSGHMPDTFDLVVSMVLLLLTIYAWVRSVRGYRLEAGDVVIDRAGPGKLHIPIAQIDNATASPELGSFFNTGFLSIGGVFGWAGKTRIRKSADMRSLEADVYGTNAKNTLLLELKNGSKVILTPADPQAMETALRVAGVGARVGSGNVGRPNPAKSIRKR